MNRDRIFSKSSLLVLLAAVAWMSLEGSTAHAQTTKGTDSDAVAVSEPDFNRPNDVHPVPDHWFNEEELERVACHDETDRHSTSDGSGDGLFARRKARVADRRLIVGFDSVFAQPRFRNHTAFTLEEEDLNANSSQRVIAMEHSLEWSPRIWGQLRLTDEFSVRGSWWNLDNAADTINLVPPANGFGEVRHPDQFGIDLSSVEPDESLDANASVDLQTFDLEMLKESMLGSWDITLGAGLRYASIETNYGVRLFNDADVLKGNLNRRQQIDALGPTISLQSSRLAMKRVRVSAMLRASMLLSDSETTVAGAEDLDLVTSFTTDAMVENEDILPVIETRWMAEFVGGRSPLGTMLFRGGVESQWYGGVDAPSGAESELGVLGLFVGLGWVR